MKDRQIAIIGGGAAGLMCAATLLEESPESRVHLFERNPNLGAKVIISGGGRCNVTTGIRDKKELFSKYTRGGNFLKTAIGQFPPEQVYDWFESHGVPLKTEDDQRVFPRSNNGKDVVGVFEQLFERHDVQVHLKETVNDILPADDGSCILKSSQGEYRFDVAVLTTGGNAYQHTGSTGDGYAFAKNFGHSLTKLGPSLNSFLCHEEWPKDLSGISLPHAMLKATTDDGEKVSADGPLLFTHFGISGPVTFALSSHLAFSTITPTQSPQVFIQPMANRNAHAWETLLTEHLSAHSAQQIQTFMREHFPQRLGLSILEQANILPDKKLAELSKKERFRLAEMLGGQLSVTLSKRRPGDEFVTAGGIPRDEIHSKTMQSKLHPALYFAGEIMDVDGVTGGFNLQASWATGRLAGMSIAHQGGMAN